MPGRREIEALGQTADRPWGILEQPLGRGDSWAAFAPFREALRDDRARLSWILDSFVYADLTTLPAPAQIGLFRILEELVPAVTDRRWWVARPAPRVVKRVGRRAPMKDRAALQPALRAWIEHTPRQEAVLTRPTDPIEILTAAQAAARECIETTVLGGIFMIGDDIETEDHPGAGTLGPFRSRPFGGPVRISLHITEARGRREVFEHAEAAMPDALVVTLLALLVQVQPDAIGRCPYPEGGPSPCGRVFVKRGPQKWCRDHQRVIRTEQLKKAFIKYRKKHRKKNNARRRRGGPSR